MYWVTHNGKLSERGTLVASGDQTTMTTFAGHKWAILAEPMSRTTDTAPLRTLEVTLRPHLLLGLALTHMVAATGARFETYR